MKNKSNKLARIGLIANFEKPTCRAVVLEAAALIARADRVVAAEHHTARMAGLKCEVFPDAAALARQVDLLLVFGGDGTMLGAVRDIGGSEAPILGINVGRLGFLTAVSSRNLASALEKLWVNDFVVETRPLIEAIGLCSDRPIRMSAFNDIVISHGAISRLIELNVTVNNKPLTCYRGDGLIVSSPTGSTAYSLSAGGPIISPGADVFAITPICAHALSNRPVILSLSSVIRVELLSKKMETIVAADGQLQANLCAGDALTIRRSRRKVHLLHPGDTSFFETIRQKLHWRGSSV
ncbi:MAG TPA: NAD(+)/NADH kinase [Candidatus Baltobacteraceae bacterium]|nr:NAD(+)/NADH kinase [Candidatus Baltobacteraceae bacterium]